MTEPDVLQSIYNHVLEMRADFAEWSGRLLKLEAEQREGRAVLQETRRKVSRLSDRWEDSSTHDLAEIRAYGKAVSARRWRVAYIVLGALVTGAVHVAIQLSLRH